MDFYRCSNTHNPDQDGFEDLYRCDFIHAISRVARRKLSRHHLDPYQRAAFRCGIIRHNTGEEERDPMSGHGIFELLFSTNSTLSLQTFLPLSH